MLTIDHVVLFFQNQNTFNPTILLAGHSACARGRAGDQTFFTQFCPLNSYASAAGDNLFCRFLTEPFFFEAMEPFSWV